MRCPGRKFWAKIDPKLLLWGKNWEIGKNWGIFKTKRKKAMLLSLECTFSPSFMKNDNF